MTGPESLRQLIEHTARTVAADERYPERQVTALQVLATLELADAVRSTAAKPASIMGNVEISTRLGLVVGAPDPRPSSVGDCMECAPSNTPNAGMPCNDDPGHFGPHWVGDGRVITTVWPL